MSPVMSWLGDEQRLHVSSCSGPKLRRKKRKMARKQRRRKNCGDRERGREEEEEKKELTQNWLDLAKNKELG